MEQINFRFDLILLVALLHHYDRLQYSDLGDQKDFQSKPLRRVGQFWKLVDNPQVTHCFLYAAMDRMGRRSPREKGTFWCHARAAIHE